jgi:ABC-type uncharacterized transport system substrate-binding protein
MIRTRPVRAGSRASRPRRRSLLRGPGLLLLALGAAVWPLTASSHPHVFVDYGVALVTSGDRIEGARVAWTFDDLFSGFILQEFDRDRNGSFSPAESRQIEEKHLAEFRRSRFFTSISVNGKEVTPGAVRDFAATATKGIVTYQFTLPFTAPLGSTTAIEVVVDDPTYYIAFIATTGGPPSQAIGAFLVECRVAHDKTGMTPDAVRCGVRRR